MEKWLCMQQETRHECNKCTYKDLGLQFVPRMVHISWPVGYSHIAFTLLVRYHHAHALDVMDQRLHKEDQSSELSWGLWSGEKEEIMGVLAALHPCVCFVAVNYQPSMSYTVVSNTSDAPSLSHPPSLHHDKECVTHTVALPFTFKSILRQKKNYGKSKYFTMQKKNT
jgi:hypothetical protein